MSRKHTWFLIATLVLLIGACGPAVTPAPTETATLPPPTETAVPPTPTTEPTATPTEVVIADYCVNCHTDKEKLIATAKEEVVVEKESEGVG